MQNVEIVNSILGALHITPEQSGRYARFVVKSIYLVRPNVAVLSLGRSCVRSSRCPRQAELLSPLFADFAAISASKAACSVSQARSHN